MTTDPLRPRLRDVAERAGVSVTTASVALRGLGRVDPQTRERVAQAARDLGYLPDQSARLLQAGGRAWLVATAYRSLPDGSGERDPKAFWEHALYSMSHELLAYNAATVLLPTVKHEYLARLPIDALLFITHDPADLAAQLPLPAGLPVVVSGLDDHAALDEGIKAWIEPDVYGLIADSLDHLRAQGARSPALLATPQPMAPLTRYEAAANRWFAHTAIAGRTVVAVDTADATSALLAEGTDAILLFGDDSLPDLEGVLYAIAAAGLRTPEDVLVMSLTESGRGAHLAPGITSMSLNGHLAGERTAEVLVKGLTTGAFESIKLSHELTQRGSTTRVR